MSLLERYNAWMTREYESEGMRTDTFALRVDEKLVCLEADGRYFLIVDTGPGMTPDEGLPTDTLYKLEDPVTGFQTNAYIEPIFVAGYHDSFSLNQRED